MEKFILGKKVSMSQIWKDKTVIPVTVIQVDDNRISLIRNTERDGYDAVQLHLGTTKKEFRVSSEEQKAFADRSVVGIDVFSEGDRVRVSSYSKGKGFQGVVKRHGFHGGPKSHGQKDRHRAPGSIGATGAQRVFKGTRMAGRMGNARTTLRKVRVVAVDPSTHRILLKGAIPGHRGSIVEISA